jgi:hypothetical protein
MIAVDGRCCPLKPAGATLHRKIYGSATNLLLVDIRNQTYQTGSKFSRLPDSKCEV